MKGLILVFFVSLTTTFAWDQQRVPELLVYEVSEKDGEPEVKLIKTQDLPDINDSKNNFFVTKLRNRDQFKPKNRFKKGKRVRIQNIGNKNVQTMQASIPANEIEYHLGPEPQNLLSRLVDTSKNVKQGAKKIKVASLRQNTKYNLLPNDISFNHNDYSLNQKDFNFKTNDYDITESDYNNYKQTDFKFQQNQFNPLQNDFYPVQNDYKNRQNDYNSRQNVFNTKQYNFYNRNSKHVEKAKLVKQLQVILERLKELDGENDIGATGNVYLGTLSNEGAKNIIDNLYPLEQIPLYNDRHGDEKNALRTGDNELMDERTAPPPPKDVYMPNYDDY